MSRVMIIAAVLAVSGPVVAQPSETAPSISATPRHSASLEVLSLVGRGLAGQFERRFTDRISAAASLGLRSRAKGDYDSLTLSTGGELRWWFTRRAPWSGFTAPAMVGFYMGARLDASRTSTRDRAKDERIGATLAISEDLSAGYRFVFWKRLEVTPSAGLGVRHEIDLDGRLPPWTRAGLSFGMTIGAMF